MDKNMFGSKRAGKRVWRDAGKHIVFGILQRDGIVLTFPITNRGKQELVPLMISHTKSGSLYYTKDWYAYTFLPICRNHIIIKKDL